MIFDNQITEQPQVSALRAPSPKDDQNSPPNLDHLWTKPVNFARPDTHTHFDHLWIIDAHPRLAPPPAMFSFLRYILIDPNSSSCTSGQSRHCLPAAAGRVAVATCYPVKKGVARRKTNANPREDGVLQPKIEFSSRARPNCERQIEDRQDVMTSPCPNSQTQNSKILER